MMADATTDRLAFFWGHLTGEVQQQDKSVMLSRAGLANLWVDSSRIRQLVPISKLK
jgi:hypothetical protein